MSFFTKLVDKKIKKTINLKYGNMIAEVGIKTCDYLIEKLEAKLEKFEGDKVESKQLRKK